MSSPSLDVYIPVVLLLVFGIILVAGALLVGLLIRPSNPTKLKITEYECGEQPIGEAWSFFNVRFYIVGLVFIIFDVESALMFPLAAVFKQFNEIGQGGVILSSFLLFMVILIAGLVYCWRKGDLDWVKSYNVPVNDKRDLQ